MTDSAGPEAAFGAISQAPFRCDWASGEVRQVGRRWTCSGPVGEIDGWWKLEFDDVWTLTSRRVHVDEVVETWTCATASATVRTTVATLWHLDVSLDCHGPAAPPRLRVGGQPAQQATDKGAWVLAAGNLGRWWWTRKVGESSDLGLIEWRQVVGWCAPSHGDPGVIELFAQPGASPDGSPTEEGLPIGPGQFTSRWRAEPVGYRDAVAGLPPWFPESLVRDVGDHFELPLADAAITSTSPVLVSTTGSQVEIHTGSNLVRVANSAGAVDIDVIGVEVAHAAQEAADRVAEQCDPHQATGVQVWLAAQAEGAERRLDFRLDAFDAAFGSLLRSAGQDPSLLAAVASEAPRLHPDDAPDLLGEVVGVVNNWWGGSLGRAAAPVGACLAMSYLALSCSVAGITLPHSLGPLGSGPAAQLEYDIVTGARNIRPAGLNWCGAALAWGLPGRPTNREAMVIAAGLIRLIPAGGHDIQAPVVGDLASVAERYLAAGDLTSVAWLLW